MRTLVPLNNRRNNLSNTGMDDFYTLFDSFFTTPRGSGGSFRLDVRENEKEYLVEADLPGIKKEEVEIDLDDGRLTIAVNREENVEDDRGNYVHRERRVSAMSRSLYLPEAQQEGVKAKLDNGVLAVTVAKADKRAVSRKIEIE